MTKAWFWPYAFIGSKAQLEYIVRDNYTDEYDEGKNDSLTNFITSFVFPLKFFRFSNSMNFFNFPNPIRVLGKRSALHIGEECLSIYGVSYMFPKDVVYAERLSDAILRMQAFGISNKMQSEMEWDLQRKSKKALLKSQGIKTFKVTESEERGLTLADTVRFFHRFTLNRSNTQFVSRKECFYLWESDI